MQKVTIVTDSTACLPPEVAEEYGIQVVPTELYFDGKAYRDGVDAPADFYLRLRQAKTLPVTSAPPPGRFLEAYRRASERAEAVLCMTLPPQFSSTHQSSQQAVRLAEEELPGVKVVSLPAPAVASGQGLVVLEAAAAARGGASLDEVATLVQHLSSQVHFFAALDTLEYLSRGGHVPRVIGWMGGLVGVRPILTVSCGRVERLSQAWSKEGAMAKMLDLMERRNPERRPIRGLLMHADAAQDAQRFWDEVQARFPCEMLLLTQFTPVMGAHSGPGVVGIAFRCV